MALLPKTVGELRRYLETYDDNIEIRICFDDDVVTFEPWDQYSVYVGLSKGTKAGGDPDVILLFPHAKL